MKDNDLLDAQRICLQLELGTARRRDVTSLLMYIRNDVAEGMVKDLAHCVAHSDRDKGYAFAFINQFMQHLISYVCNGGTLTVQTLFEIEDVIRELQSELAILGIHLDASKVSSHREPLLEALRENLDGVTVEVENSIVVSCIFVKQIVDHIIVFGFRVKFTGLTQGITPLPDGTELIFPVLVSH